MKAEEVAKLFHDTYEKLAPDYGYETRKASAVPWSNVPDQNKKLMIATCEVVLLEIANNLAENASVPSGVKVVVDGT